MTLLTALVLWPAASAWGRGVAIVRDGVAVAHIEVTPQATDVEKLAARQLATYIEKASGAKPPIVVGCKQGRAIALVSEGPPSAQTTVTIVARDGRAEIRGNCLVAVLFGVHFFIRDAVGFRWYASGDVGTLEKWFRGRRRS